MEPASYLRLFRRYWVLIAACGLVGAVLAAVIASAITPQYRATATLFFALGRSESASDLVEGSVYTQNVVKSYAAVATTPIVLGPVIEELGLDLGVRGLAGKVQAEAPLDTVLIEISATDPSPEAAARIANEVADQLSTTAETLSPRGPQGSYSIEVTTVAEATVPAQPVFPPRRLWTVAGLLGGLLVGFGGAVARTWLRNSVRSEEDVAPLTNAPVLAEVERSRRTDPATARIGDELNPRSEAFRRLRVNLQSLGVGDSARTLLVTSALSSEGKTLTSINLAIALASANHKVLLIDADLRRPRVGEYLGLEDAVGLTSVLVERTPLQTVVQQWGSPNLGVLPSGELPVNPAEVLSGAAMGTLIKEALDRYDVVLLDGAPLLPVTDSTGLVKHTDGAVLVVNSRKLRREDFKRALSTLSLSGARVFGIVLNQMPGRRRTQKYYEDADRRPAVRHPPISIME